MDLVKMEKYYENLCLGSDFYSSQLLLEKWRIQKELDKVSNPYSDSFLRFDTFTDVNAYYNDNDNSISITHDYLKFKILLIFFFVK